MEQTRYLIEYDSGIEEKLRSLSKPVRDLIRKAIEKKLAVDPITFGKPLRYTLKGFRRLRVGDYRVIYQIIEERIVVLVIDLGHRRDIYDEA